MHNAAPIQYSMQYCSAGKVTTTVANALRCLIPSMSLLVIHAHVSHREIPQRQEGGRKAQYQLEGTARP
eukprot:CAMPEP_0181204166 /NCGR_PEP_ID=MMETSP1096-20121128/19787_1 /TAXON_ID=156174 ORGANISM="Chrysochromulina ericina, Strain CCMP281" /NCGR_SAMPLE_ID=MMETSP1096 /ASSEMBLY_ACC=CAM_ASM_000453 /LENGTH=68 /DNA_ID=CAMNT_0023294841 /DNA_START=425 /DNA_END=627 /DNA_ORIENTATION=+